MPRDIDPPLFEVVEGWTKQLGPFTIARGGVAIDLTGYAVTLILRRASGTLVTVGGVVEVAANQVTNRGQVYYTPVATDFIYEDNLYTVHQPYQLHWKLVNGSDVAFSPSGAPSIVLVHRA